MKINRLALFVASVHRADPRYLTDLDTVMGVPDPSGKGIISGGLGSCPKLD